MAGRVTRSFYRIVMRTAKLHDAHPALKGLIVTHRIRFYDRQSKAWVSIGQAGDSKEKVSFESAALMRELTGGGVYYLPERSAVQIARNAFKQKMKETDVAVIDLHLDVATSCIRLLEQNLARGRKLGILDWLPPRSHPPQDLYDIQLADSPGVGNMLLAHPLLVQSALTRAVIILVQYEKEKGTFGLVVNRRVPLKVTDLLDTASSLQGVGMSRSGCQHAHPPY